MGPLPSGLSNRLGPLAQGLVQLAQWRMPVLPGMLVVGGIPPAAIWPRIMQILKRLAASCRGGALEIRMDAGTGHPSSVMRPGIGQQSIMLENWTETTLRETMGSLLAEQPRPPISKSVCRDESQVISFILQLHPNVQAQAADGAGVGFTRDPSTGEDRWIVRFLTGGQGRQALTSSQAMGFEQFPPTIQKQLSSIKEVLEKQTGGVQEIEFAVVGGEVILQRMGPARLSAQATVAVALDMAQAKIISESAALAKVDPSILSQLLVPQFEPEARSRARVLARGFAASPGVAVGKPAFHAKEALQRSSGGEAVILVQTETYAQDVPGMQVSRGILTTSGGMTSHAAVVARGWGLCAVVGAGEVRINGKRRCLMIEGRVWTSDDTIALDGTTGEVLEGDLPVISPPIDGHVAPLLTWADRVRKLVVLANADTPEDARKAREMGAQGIGLCRTEHMFFAHDRLSLVRKILLGLGHTGQERLWHELQAMQQKDFEAIFRMMEGLPVTIRLLDAPLHEFLPAESDTDACRELAQSLQTTTGRLRDRLQAFREVNPMMGFRGCRLSLTYPQILATQVRAILGAIQSCEAQGLMIQVGIMFPLVSMEEELIELTGRVREEIEDWTGRGSFQEFSKKHTKSHADTASSDSRSSRMRLSKRIQAADIQLGVMIETPRAALLAGRLAKHVDFMSLGTNDLTQFTFGISREDAGLFLPSYLQNNLLANDPFIQLDIDGTGRLIRDVVLQARQANPQIRIGLCGEHGGDPASIDFAHDVGLDSVSCSPMRLPSARLAAARACIVRRAEP